MADVVVLVNQLPMPVMVAWILWLAWCVFQIAWFRRARIAVPVWQPAPSPRPARHRVAHQRGRSNPALTPEAAVTQGVLAGAPDVPRPPASAVSGSEGQPGPVAEAETNPGLAAPHRD